MNDTFATPSASEIAVSNDSASRCCASSRTRRRSITASIVCFFFLSSVGGWSRSVTMPSTRARMKPLATSSRNTCWCSPLRSAITGASTMMRASPGKREHLIDHLAHGLRGERLTVIRATRFADAREQQAQVVVDFRDRADGGTWVVRRRFLFDRNRRRQTFDVVDVRLFHHRQELPRIRRQRFDVAALAFRVQRIERERRLARAGQTRDDDELDRAESSGRNFSDCGCGPHAA